MLKEETAAAHRLRRQEIDRRFVFLWFAVLDGQGSHDTHLGGGDVAPVARLEGHNITLGANPVRDLSVIVFLVEVSDGDDLVDRIQVADLEAGGAKKFLRHVGLVERFGRRVLQSDALRQERVANRVFLGGLGHVFDAIAH